MRVSEELVGELEDCCSPFIVRRCCENLVAKAGHDFPHINSLVFILSKERTMIIIINKIYFVCQVKESCKCDLLQLLLDTTRVRISPVIRAKLSGL
jgi:hypothetical protein